MMNELNRKEDLVSLSEEEIWEKRKLQHEFWKVTTYNESLLR